MTATVETGVAHRSFADTVALYLRRRVLIVLFLGFSAGLPFALSASTLSARMKEAGVDLGTIGLFAFVGTPYVVKFLWAPFIDALDAPVLSRLLGRRRGWLILSQFILMAAIVLLAVCDPFVVPPLVVAVAALLVATASATQDIVIDAFRIESLDETEQPVGMSSYVAAYRVGTLASTAGALLLVTGLEKLAFSTRTAWIWSLIAMAALVIVGIVTTLRATEPEKSAQAESAHAHQDPFHRVVETAVSAFSEFLGRDMAIAVLVFVVLFKFTDALAGAMITPFVYDIGFSREQYVAIIKIVGFAAVLTGGIAGGFVAKRFALPTCLWIGGILQALANLTFSWQAIIGTDVTALAFAITVENFTSAIGTVFFVTYLSGLCKNPLHTASQFALLTALSAVGRIVLSSPAGYLAAATGWVWFFAICALVAIPGLVLLAWLQRRRHFEQFAKYSA